MKAKIGLVFTHPTLGNVIIIAIHPLGTIDVRNIFTDRCYRISGLPLPLRRCAAAPDQRRHEAVSQPPGARA